MATTLLHHSKGHDRAGEWIRTLDPNLGKVPEGSTPDYPSFRRTAVDLLLALPQVAKSPFFFPADWGEGHFVGVVRVLDRVCAMARLEDVTPHTLRHTFASVAGDLGFSELTIAALLGHAARGVTQRYIHIDEALRLAADKMAAELSDLLAGRATMPRTRGRRTDPAEWPLEIASTER